MQSTVVELSRYTSDDTESNAQWTSRLVQPVSIEDGDYIQVKQAFIDTRLIDSQSILIESNVQWTLQFMYWISNVGINTIPTNPINSIIPDGLPYVLMDDRDAAQPNYNNKSCRPVVEDFTINIPAGIYERSFLAEYITRQLQGIKAQPNTYYGDTSFSNDNIMPQYDASNNFTGFNKSAKSSRFNVVSVFQRPVYFGENETGTFAKAMFYTDASNAYWMSFFHPLTNSPNYYYLNREIGLQIYKTGSIKTISYDGDDWVLSDGSMIGAQQVAFVYNDENGDGRFSFQYLHSPIYNNGNQSVGTFNYCANANEDIAGTRTASLQAYSGIMFVGMYTNLTDDYMNDPFFNQLGFKYNDLICPEVQRYFSFNNTPFINGGNYVGFDYELSFLPYTTRNKMTQSDLTTNNAITLAGNVDGDASYQIVDYQNPYAIFTQTGQTWYNFNISNITETVKASNSPISSTSNGGHYLIELQGSYTNEYINQDKTYQIKAIIGNYFLSGDSFCMSMGGDSYIYQHSGQATTLTSVKVRILNPITKLPADELGKNSCIYLQITKEKPVNMDEKTQKTAKTITDTTHITN